MPSSMTSPSRTGMHRNSVRTRNTQVHAGMTQVTQGLFLSAMHAMQDAIIAAIRAYRGSIIPSASSGTMCRRS